MTATATKTDCYGIDTANNDSNPMDDNNHGTHVAGTIGARGNNSVGVVGVNWNVQIMACKFLDATGSGSDADAIECLEYVKTMKERGGQHRGDEQFMGRRRVFPSSL
jgi:subtilisin family serine protease